jgi:hypothetical protein
VRKVVIALLVATLVFMAAIATCVAESSPVLVPGEDLFLVNYNSVDGWLCLSAIDHGTMPATPDEYRIVAQDLNGSTVKVWEDVPSDYCLPIDIPANTAWLRACLVDKNDSQVFYIHGSVKVADKGLN